MIKLFLYLLLLVAVYRLSYRATTALFSTSSVSTTNTFAASAVFPSISPGPSPILSPTPTETPVPTITLTPTPTPTVANHIVISEVQVQGTNNTDDFVELYNPTNVSVVLTGWKIQKKTSPGTISSLVATDLNGKTIPAHGFFLWASTQNSFNISVGADASSSSTLSADNSIALLNPSDIIIDQVGWGSGVNQFFEGSIFPTSPSTNGSIERKAYVTSNATSMTSGADVNKGNGFDAGNNSTDFIVRTTSQPQNSGSPPEVP
jgi:hypothetical protein